MPLSYSSLFRIVVLLVLAFHVFYMYCTARTFDQGFGISTGVVIFSAVFALAMLVPLVWAVTVPEFPEIYTRYVRARRRWSQGKCRQCGYAVDHTEHGACPECGTPIEEPPAYRVTMGTLRRYAVMNLLAWVIGCGVGEWWISADESAFRNEAVMYSIPTTGDDRFYTRYSRWPAKDQMLWHSTTGFQREPS